MSYLTQQDPVMIKASEPTTIKMLLMTEKKYIQRVRRREDCADLKVSEEVIVPKRQMSLKKNVELQDELLNFNVSGTENLSCGYQNLMTEIWHGRTNW